MHSTTSPVYSTPYMSVQITILALFDRISTYHTLAPWLTGYYRAGWRTLFPESDGVSAPPRITYTDDPRWCLRTDKNEHLIIVRRFLKPPVVDLDLMERLRGRYRRIFFLNGNAGGGIHRPEILPYIDRFYNKAIFSDRSTYRRALYGAELFSQYYHDEFDIDDDPEILTPAIDATGIEKIHTHWNIGVGDFPRKRTPQRIGVALSRMPFGGPRLAVPVYHRKLVVEPSPISPPSPEDALFDVNARLGNPGYPTIAFHRQHLGQVLREASERNGWRVARDRVDPRRYRIEMERSLITFSPFGWGELCFRDFEAIRAGSLLIKPDMSHLETWPDVFVPGETYVPVRWDGADLEETVARYLEDRDERERIARNAHARLASELASLPRRSAGILRDLLHDPT